MARVQYKACKKTKYSSLIQASELHHSVIIAYDYLNLAMGIVQLHLEPHACFHLHDSDFIGKAQFVKVYSANVVPLYSVVHFMNGWDPWYPRYLFHCLLYLPSCAYVCDAVLVHMCTKKLPIYIYIYSKQRNVKCALYMWMLCTRYLYYARLLSLMRKKVFLCTTLLWHSLVC